MSIVSYDTKYVKGGIRIAPKDSNLDNLNPKQDAFNSKFPLLKAYMTGEETYTFSSEPGTGTTDLFSITHNLGYKPASYVNHRDMSDVYRGLMPWLKLATGGIPPADWQLEQEINYFVTDTILKVQYRRTNVAGSPPGGSGTTMNGKTFKFKYYIFADAGA